MNVQYFPPFFIISISLSPQLQVATKKKTGSGQGSYLVQGLVNQVTLQRQRVTAASQKGTFQCEVTQGGGHSIPKPDSL